MIISARRQCESLICTDLSSSFSCYRVKIRVRLMRLLPLQSIKVVWRSSKMEVFGKSPMVSSANVIYLSAILGHDCDGPIQCHKCDWKCENENVCGNMYRCKLTGLAHVCDKNCNQQILNSLCRASSSIFHLSPAEQAVKGVRRKLDNESYPSSESCPFKHRQRDALFHASPFERSFTVVSPICSPAGDGMELS